MARHFDADPTVPLAGERPSVRGGRIEVVGEARSMVVGAERVVMGRAPQCGLVLDDPSVSALHAEARGTSEGVHLVDLNSRNGTFVGGNRVVDLYLNTPTEFTCGSRRLRFVPLGTLDALPDTAEVTRFGRLVATTRPMREALERLRKLAASDLPMVLTGETGTGKELAARAVHEASARCEKPFVPVNCASVPENLLEDELFGHVRGAFTGADRDRPGLFVEADGGTLLFDEIGEMSAKMQAKLLRVLESKMVRPVGGSSERRVDVRVLAATHASLEAQVNRKAFREDLYFRMCRVTVELPPLRERLSDLPFLVREILADLGRPDMKVEEQTMAELHGCAWPGNVRELRSLLEVSVVGASANVLSLEEAFRGTQGMELRANLPLEAVLRSMTYAQSKKEMKWRYYTGAYSRFRGNVTQIAAFADVAPATARNELRKIGLLNGPDESPASAGPPSPAPRRDRKK
jgi:DNA-binding NtrC family response regulator